MSNRVALEKPWLRLHFTPALRIVIEERSNVEGFVVVFPRSASRAFAGAKQLSMAAPLIASNSSLTVAL